jgi:hypothetical protein
MEKLHTTTNAWCRGYRSAFGVAQFRKVKFVVAGQRQDRAIQSYHYQKIPPTTEGKANKAKSRAGLPGSSLHVWSVSLTASGADNLVPQLHDHG